MKLSATTRDAPARDAGYADLFPGGAVVVEHRGEGREAELLAEELDRVRGAAPKRRHEFAAGRACARQALARLGAPAGALLPGPDRAPLWPEGMVGSITHTDGYCAAVAGRRDQFRGLGLDAEVIARVEPELWPSICSEADLDWVRSRDAGIRATAAALVFSAKEAFFKCQFPVTGTWLEFGQASVRIRGQAFRIVPRGDGIDSRVMAAIEGRWVIRDALVITAATWRATDMPAPGIAGL